jgi:hypothetical protein
MKRSIFMALILAMAFMANAQITNPQTDQARVRFGLKAGINVSSLNMNSESAQISSITSFYAGGTALFPVSKHFNIQSELIWSGEGTESTGIKIELNYVRIPLLFQYQHVSGFHVEAGPQLGILVTEKATAIETKEEFEVKKQLSRVSTTLAIGFGYRMKNGLGLDFRYAKGIDNPVGATNAKLVVASGGLSFVF